MPVYEFDCRGCRKPFQVFTPTMKWDHIHCPACGSAQVTKKLSTFAVISGGGSDSCGGDMSSCGMSGGCGGEPGRCPKFDSGD